MADDWQSITENDDHPRRSESRFVIRPLHRSDAEVLREVAELALRFPETPVSIVCASDDHARAVYRQARAILDPAGCEVTFVPARCPGHRADGVRCALIDGHDGGHL